MKLETSYSGRPGNNTANPLVMRTSVDAEGYLLYYSDITGNPELQFRRIITIRLNKAINSDLRYCRISTPMKAHMTMTNITSIWMTLSMIPMF